MVLQQKLLAAAGNENMLECPNYSGLVTEDTESSTMWQEVLSAVQVNCSVPFHIIHCFNPLASNPETISGKSPMYCASNPEYHSGSTLLHINAFSSVVSL
jgi:hypothetical protein